MSFRNFRVVIASCLVLSALLGSAAQARLVEMPNCKGRAGESLAIDNARVIQFKFNTPNQYKDRARVLGQVIQLFPSRPSHSHFEIQIGSRQQDTLEVVYNRSFGTPEVKVGDAVEACGDYITSNAATERYRASPSGAIIHWLHENSRGGSHPDGYVVVNARTLYGFGSSPLEVDAASGAVSASENDHSADRRIGGRDHRREESRRERRNPRENPRHGRHGRDRDNAANF
jgi:hypothetical protein